MNDEKIKAVIYEVLRRIAPEFDLETLAPDDNIRAVLDIDSFDWLNFFIGINEALGVDVPESDYGQLVTLMEIVNYLSARITWENNEDRNSQPFSGTARPVGVGGG